MDIIYESEYLDENSKWDSVNTLTFISLVKAKPCLYDKSRSGFSTKEMKNSAWNSIANSMSMTVGDVRKRWKTLRTIFTRKSAERRVVAFSGNNNEWEFFDPMKFILPFIRRKRRHSNILKRNNSTSYPHHSVSPSQVKTSCPARISSSCVVDSETSSPFTRPSSCIFETSVIEPKNGSTGANDMMESETHIRLFNEVAKNLCETLKTVKECLANSRLREDDADMSYMSCLIPGFRLIPDNKKSECLIELLNVILTYSKFSDQNIQEH